MSLLDEKLIKWRERILEVHYSKQSQVRYFNAVKFIIEAYNLRNIFEEALQENKEPDIDKIVNAVNQHIVNKKVRPFFYTFAMSSFLNYAFGEAFTVKIKKYFVKSKKQTRSPRIIRNLEIIKRIIELLEEPFDIMARIQWETGCRLSAVTGIRMNIPTNVYDNKMIFKVMARRDDFFDEMDRNEDDFYLSGDYYVVRLHEKRGKEYERPISEELYNELVSYKEFRIEKMRYYAERVIIDKKKYSTKFIKHLFTTRLFEYSPSHYDRVLKRTGKMLGLKTFSSHWFRGTRARQLLDMGMPIVDVQRFLGHEDITTTARYTTLDIKGKENFIINSSLKLFESPIKIEKKKERETA